MRTLPGPRQLDRDQSLRGSAFAPPHSCAASNRKPRSSRRFLPTQRKQMNADAGGFVTTLPEVAACSPSPPARFRCFPVFLQRAPQQSPPPRSPGPAACRLGSASLLLLSPALSIADGCNRLEEIV